MIPHHPLAVKITNRTSPTRPAISRTALVQPLILRHQSQLWENRVATFADLSQCKSPQPTKVIHQSYDQAHLASKSAFHTQPLSPCHSNKKSSVSETQMVSSYSLTER